MALSSKILMRSVDSCRDQVPRTVRNCRSHPSPVGAISQEERKNYFPDSGAELEIHNSKEMFAWLDKSSG